MKKLVITAALLAALSAAGATAYKAAKNNEQSNETKTTHVVERNAEAEQYIDYICYEYYCAAMERGETLEFDDYTHWLLDSFCESDDYEQIVCEAYGITYEELDNLK